jgi:dTDP-4-dehydrorhamnose reductase
MEKNRLIILDEGFKQEIKKDVPKSEYRIEIIKKKKDMPQFLENKVNLTWRKFEEKNKLIAKNNITYFFISKKSRDCDIVKENEFKYVQSFGKTKIFQKYADYAKNNSLVALSSICIIKTSDKKLIFGLKKNMSKKISGFSGYIQKKDVKMDNVDIWRYLSRTVKEELNLEEKNISRIYRIGKIYSPLILDKKGKLNNHVYNNVFVINLKISSKEILKNFKRNFQFDKLLVYDKESLLKRIKKDFPNFSIHCIGAIYLLLIHYKEYDKKKLLKLFHINHAEKRKTILITGASGFIGGYISEKFSTEYEIIGVDIKKNDGKFFRKFYLKDITNINNLKRIFNENKIDIIIHSAAEKNLDWCEQNRGLSYKNNFLVTKNLYVLSKKNFSKFIFISSDQVFDGKKGDYSENAKKRPINYYGTLKDLAEEFLLNDKNVVICRTALVFGNLPRNQKIYFDRIKNEKKLIVQGYILDHIKYLLKRRKKIILPRNEYCNPTNNNTLFLQLSKIIKKNLSGVFHCCGGERISRYSFGIKIANALGLDSSLIDSSPSWDKLRAKDVSLNFDHTSKKLSLKFPKVDEMVKKVLEEKNENIIC